MKNIIKYVGLYLGLGLALQACNDWTIPENEVIQDLDHQQLKSEEYYEKLRAYKKTDHQIAFGWFGFWNGGTSTSARGSLRSIPDSVDIVSIWGDKYNLPQHFVDDMRFVQEKYGTRVTYTVFSHNMSNLFKGGVCPFPNEAQYIPEAAKALTDSINKYGYDGIDFDHECGPGDLFANKENMTTLLREMRKNLGPDKLIMVDGFLSMISEEGLTYVNYGIEQAYGANRPNYLQSKYDKIKERLAPEKFVIAANFESGWANGGGTYTDEKGDTMPMIYGFAVWQPKDGGCKGGIGAFHMEYEYAHDPEYKFLRQAIQIMNPANPNN